MCLRDETVNLPEAQFDFVDMEFPVVATVSKMGLEDAVKVGRDAAVLGAAIVSGQAHGGVVNGDAHEQVYACVWFLVHPHILGREQDVVHDYIEGRQPNIGVVFCDVTG
jgi:hypothetical protein